MEHVKTKFILKKFDEIKHAFKEDNFCGICLCEYETPKGEEGKEEENPETEQ